MKPRLSGFLRTAQFPLMLVAGLSPAAALVALQCAPHTLPVLASQLALFLLLSELCLLLPGKIRLAAGLLGCAALAAQGFLLFPVAQQALLALIPLSLCALLMYSLQFAAWPREKEIPFGWYAAGVFAHLFSQLSANAANRLGLHIWEPVTPLLTGAFVLFLLLVLLSMNRSAMTGASLGRQRVPSVMRGRNILLIVASLLLALLIASIPAIIRAAEYAWALVLRGVAAVLAFIARLLEDTAPQDTGSRGGGMDMLPAIEEQAPSALALLLEKVLIVLTAAVLVLLCLWLARIALRKAHALLRLLIARMTRYMAAASQDYVDEVTDTREDGGEALPLLTRLRRRLTSPKPATPNERIRFRYRALLRRHPDWRASQTARETLPPEAAALYEKARYSGQETSPQEADAFARTEI